MKKKKTKGKPIERETLNRKQEGKQGFRQRESTKRQSKWNTNIEENFFKKIIETKRMRETILKREGKRSKSKKTERKPKRSYRKRCKNNF